VSAALGLLLTLDIALTLIVLLPGIFCIEPSFQVGGASVTSGSRSCNHVPFVLYTLLPPGAFLLPALLGLGALAMQSARGLQLYASSNGSSITSSLIALIISVFYAPSLGSSLTAIPALLLLLKLAAAQLLPRLLATWESERPVRGWRGVYEVRSGPAERAGGMAFFKA
jgi:hypothetical protein